MNYYRAFLTGFAPLVLLLFSSCSGNPDYPGPLTPEEAIEDFNLHEDFDIEVFASEPLVNDPVEMVVDEQGRIFVMEMADYPFKSQDLDDEAVVGEVSQYPFNPEVIEAGGRIRLLIDSDGDGTIDDSSIFAEGIREGTSLLPWDGGLLVTSAGEIIYFKDTTGDLKADHREVLFTGFSTTNVQAQITSLRYGVDNWIYASNDGRPGEVTFTRDPEAPAVSMSGADFRFRLDKGLFERATGVGRVGRAINDWGHRFMTSAVPHVRHAVIPQRYLARHNHLPTVPNAIDNVNDHGLTMFQLTPAPYWRAERSARRQQQYDEAGLDRIEDVRGEFTGATGGTLYLGHAFPESYYGNLFTGEHAGNLVHRDHLTPHEESPTYIASRDPSELDREFLASTDPWFRPTTFTVGPDGYLYVVDMYRQHTEHPIAIPEDLKENPDLDFNQGLDRGRIYRIVPKEDRAGDTPSWNVREMGAERWIELLSHPNQWWRLTAQRLLVEQQDDSVADGVEQILYSQEDPRARLHALYVLEGLDALNEEAVLHAIGDPHPGLREHGLILAESYPSLLPQILEAVDDEAPRVAFQAVLSAGQFSGDQVVTTLADVVDQRGEDPWFRSAVMSSEPGSSVELAAELLSRSSFAENPEAWRAGIIRNLSFAAGSRNNASEALEFLDLLVDSDAGWREAGVSGLTEGLQRHEDQPDLKAIVEEVGEVDLTNGSEEAITTLRQYFEGR